MPCPSSSTPARSMSSERAPALRCASPCTPEEEGNRRTSGGKRNMTWVKKLAVLAGATATAALIGGAGAGSASAEEVTLRMAVPDWPPTRIMKDMFDKTYKAPSGNTVKLDVDF